MIYRTIVLLSKKKEVDKKLSWLEHAKGGYQPTLDTIYYYVFFLSSTYLD